MTIPLLIAPTIHSPVPAEGPRKSGTRRTTSKRPQLLHIFPDINHDLAAAVRQAVGGDLLIARSCFDLQPVPPSGFDWSNVPATPGYLFGPIPNRAFGSRWLFYVNWKGKSATAVDHRRARPNHLSHP